MCRARCTHEHGSLGVCMSVGLGGCIKARVFDLTPPCMLQDMEQAPDFAHVPDVFRVFMF